MNAKTKTVELRSDTYTRPTPQMRQAMAEAEVGNDGVGEDPTVNRLEAIAAERFGKEAAMFVPSGTMGNLCAVLTHCQRGDAVILEHWSHIFRNETGNISAVAGCLPHTLKCPEGIYDVDELKATIDKGSLVHPRTGLVCLENTHNQYGGIAVSAERIREIAAIVHKRDIPVHMDGARIFNAAIALDTQVKQLAAPVDSVQFCFSKGLACPVGSMLVGSRNFIDRARRMRRMIGGGMRQAGVLAAPALVALDTMVDRLAEDHRRAHQLAVDLSKLPGLSVDPGRVQTNMVYVRLDDAAATDHVVDELAGQGIKAFATGKDMIRLVTHYEIEDEDIARTVAAFEQIMQEARV